MLLLKHLLLVMRAWCLSILERTASCDCTKVLDLELLQRVSQGLVLLAQRNVLPLNPLEVLDAHLELMLVLLQLTLVVLPQNLHLLLLLLLITSPSW